MNGIVGGRSRVVMLLVAVLVGVLSAPAESAVLITSRAALGANDSIDWADLGPSGTILTPPVGITSALGVNAQVNNPDGPIGRLEQDLSWDGNFGPGDAVLVAGSTLVTSVGPLVIDFDQAVMGAGAQIQTVQFDPFTAFIDVFYTDLTSETFSLVGLSNNLGDNSAIFIGVLSGAFDIDRIEFRTSVGPPGQQGAVQFGINQLSLVSGEDGDGPVEAPSPAGVALLGLGLVVLEFARRRRRPV